MGIVLEVKCVLPFLARIEVIISVNKMDMVDKCVWLRFLCTVYIFEHHHHKESWCICLVRRDRGTPTS